MANTKFLPQSSKARSIKGFDENISKLPLYVNVFHHYVSLFNMVSQEVVSHFYVCLLSHEKLGFGLGIWIQPCHFHLDPASPFSSRSSGVAVLIGVDTGLSSTMLNFFITSFVYLA
jgi:hypothetical protein